MWTQKFKLCILERNSDLFPLNTFSFFKDTEPYALALVVEKKLSLKKGEK